MAKKKPKLLWWSPRRWVNMALPSGTWTGRRQWLMQTGSALLVVLLGWMLNSPREHPVRGTQPQLQADREVAPRGEATFRKITVADSLAVRVHDVATVATAPVTNTNALPVVPIFATAGLHIQLHGATAMPGNIPVAGAPVVNVILKP